jgi:hypothetical protein
MVIYFGVKKQVAGLQNCYFKANIQKAWNGPSTQLIEATSYVEMSNATIETKGLSNFSSYQTLTAGKNWWSTKHQRRSPKGGWSRTTIAAKPVNLWVLFHTICVSCQFRLITTSSF